MGRIKTTPIKRAAKKLISEHRDKFSPDFNKNKKVVTELLELNSKKIRNVIAGYVTRLAKTKEE